MSKEPGRTKTQISNYKAIRKRRNEISRFSIELYTPQAKKLQAIQHMTGLSKVAIFRRAIRVMHDVFALTGTRDQIAIVDSMGNVKQILRWVHPDSSSVIMPTDE